MCCVYTHAHTRMCVCLCVCMCVCACACSRVVRMCVICAFLSTYHVHLTFTPCRCKLPYMEEMIWTLYRTGLLSTLETFLIETSLNHTHHSLLTPADTPPGSLCTNLLGPLPLSTLYGRLHLCRRSIATMSLSSLRSCLHQKEMVVWTEPSVRRDGPHLWTLK